MVEGWRQCSAAEPPHPTRSLPCPVMDLMWIHVYSKKTMKITILAILFFCIQAKAG